MEKSLSNAGKNISPEWAAWRDAGARFVPQTVAAPAQHAAVSAPVSAMPVTVAAAPIPAMWRTSVATQSTVGNNRAAWQVGFAPSMAKVEADARIRALLPNLEEATLGDFDLPQLNAILARLEHLQSRGVDLSYLKGLSDYSTVPLSEHDFSIGLTLQDRIHLKHDNLWKFNPNPASHPTAYDDIGGLLAHEYGHVVFHQLSPNSQNQIIDIYKAHKATAAADISTYSIESIDEWFGEVFTKITAPGYAPGTLRYDSELWSILAADGKVSTLDLPVAKAVVDTVPPLPEAVAKGPYKASVEMVPVATLRRYADIDIKSLDDNLVAKVREDMVAHGMREPIVLEYSPTEARVALTDGAARLAIAREMGVKYVPARVVRSKGPFSGTVQFRSKSVPKAVFADDHVPLQMRPSQVLPPEQWTTTAFPDVVTAPPLPPLSSPTPPPFQSPHPTSLTLKSLPPGKKLGGMSSKQIYVTPDGRQWLVKPKKAFIDDVALAKQAVDVEASIHPIADRLGLNIAAVRSFDVHYPWKPDEPLKHVGASIQPMTPGVVPLPEVAAPEMAEVLPKAKVLLGDLDSSVVDTIAMRLAGLREQGVDLSLVKGLKYNPDLGASGLASAAEDVSRKGKAKWVHFSEMKTPDGVGVDVADTVAHEIGHIIEESLPNKTHMRIAKLSSRWAEVSKYAERTGEFFPEVFAYVTSGRYLPGTNAVADEVRALLIEAKVITPITPAGARIPIPGNVAWDQLSDGNLNELARHQILDWFIGNDDGHIGQFMVQSDGHILGIDKDAAFWELPSQYAYGDSIPEYGKHIVHTWWADMTPERLKRLKPSAVERILDDIDAIGDADYRSYIERNLDILTAHPTGVKMSREQWAAAIMERKHNMRADFTAYYQRQLSDLVEAGVAAIRVAERAGARLPRAHRQPAATAQPGHQAEPARRRTGVARRAQGRGRRHRGSRRGGHRLERG